MNCFKSSVIANVSSIIDRRNRVFATSLLQNRFWDSQSLSTNSYQAFLWKQSNRGVKLTTHFHPLPRTIMVEPESASELYGLSDRPLSAKLVPTSADRVCHVVSMTDPYCRILGFLDRSRYFSFEVAPQLYSGG
jgi:hypothetical protein